MNCTSILAQFYLVGIVVPLAFVVYLASVREIQQRTLQWPVVDDFFASINSPSHKNCRRFRRFSRIVTSEERDFPLAFTLVVHQDAHQVARLVRMIHRPSNYYCIHPDKNSTKSFSRAIEGIAKCFGSSVEVVPVKDRIKVIWGKPSLLQPQFVCAKMALKRPAWKYLFNLVGQEIPLRTNLELIAAAKALNNSNLIEAVEMGIFKHRVERVNRTVNATWYKGSLYGVFRRGFVDFFVNAKATDELRELVSDPELIKHPDELFFQTIAYNPIFEAPGGCFNIMNEPKGPEPHLNRFVLWIGSDKCATKYVRMVCILGWPNVPQMKKSSALFANKMHANFHPGAYDAMEAWYFDRVRRERKLGHFNPNVLNVSVYAQLPCSQNHRI